MHRWHKAPNIFIYTRVVTKQQNHLQIGGPKQATELSTHRWHKARNVCIYVCVATDTANYAVCPYVQVAQSAQNLYPGMGSQKQTNKLSTHRRQKASKRTVQAAQRTQHIHSHMGGQRQATKVTKLSTHGWRQASNRNIYTYYQVAQRAQHVYLHMGGQKQATKLSTDRWPKASNKSIYRQVALPPPGPSWTHKLMHCGLIVAQP